MPKKDAVVRRYVTLRRVAKDAAASENERRIAKAMCRRIKEQHPDIDVAARKHERAASGHGTVTQRPAAHDTAVADTSIFGRVLERGRAWVDDALSRALDEALADLDEWLENMDNPKPEKETGMSKTLRDKLDDVDVSVIIEEGIDDEEITIEMTLPGEVFRAARRAPKAFLAWMWDLYTEADYDDAPPGDDDDLDDDDDDIGENDGEED